ncbi:MAG TPA: hypothetical protein VF532_11625 [Candidatus Angelobacter sp.]
MLDPLWAARAKGVAVALFLTVAGLLGYAIRQHYQVTRLSAENDAMVSTLKDTRAQVASLTAKIDSLAAPPAAQPSEPVPAHAPAIQHRKPAPRHNANDARFKRMQTQLDAQGRAIDSTRQELSSARTELEGGIARNHEEVVALQKKGERNYFEFDLDKSKQFQRTGPVAISLRKANTKHMFADLELRVEDAQVSQKHVNVLQPVVFYAGEQGRPVELVINSIRKDHIHGYISAPRYTAAELAASASDTARGDANAAANKRQKLEVPR